MEAKKQIINKQIQKNNTRLREVIEIDFDKQIEVIDVRSYHKETKALLLSPTRVIGYFSEPALDKIPRNILQETSAIGSDLMQQLEYLHKHKCKDIEKVPYLSEVSKEMFWALIQFMIDNQWQIKAVEKHVTNGYWHCYIDLIVRDHQMNLIVCEIKTRSNNESKLSDKLQLVLNMRIAGVNNYGYLVIINRKTKKVTYEKVHWRDMKPFINRLIKWFVDLGSNEKYSKSILYVEAK